MPSLRSISDGPTLRGLFDKYRPHGVINLAAESHVDRSIDDPAEFIRTNIVGTFALLQEALHWRGQEAQSRAGIPVPSRFDRRSLRIAWR